MLSASETPVNTSKNLSNPTDIAPGSFWSPWIPTRETSHCLNILLTVSLPTFLVLMLMSYIVKLIFRMEKRESILFYHAVCQAGLSRSDVRETLTLQLQCKSLLRSLTDGHSKTSKALVLLKFGMLKVRHIIIIRRLMYHYHLITRPNEQLIKKVYLKQKQNCLKGDWYRTLGDDLKFIGETINDDHISLTPKYDYRKLVQQKVQKAAFLSYLELKENLKRK